MTESRLSRFARREVVAPHAPPDGQCPGGTSFAAPPLFRWPIPHCHTVIISKDRLGGNRKTRVGR
jgi:hypothetical protein